MTRLHVGCAMWTHRAWPATSQKLRSYAGWCNAVEGNTTFYATPTRDTVASWAAQTGPEFRFVVKLPKHITHERRLTDVDAELRRFLDAIEPLGPRTHALWVQLPASFGPDDVATLARFLGQLPRSERTAVEVRHPAFFTDRDAERALEAALAPTATEWIPFDTTVFFRASPTTAAEREAWARKPRLPPRTRALTDRPIVRYLGRDDAGATAAGWRGWVELVVDWLRDGRSPTVFIHTPDNVDAPMLARRFHDEVRSRLPAVAALPEITTAEPLTLF